MSLLLDIYPYKAQKYVFFLRISANAKKLLLRSQFYNCPMNLEEQFESSDLEEDLKWTRLSPAALNTLLIGDVHLDQEQLDRCPWLRRVTPLVLALFKSNEVAFNEMIKMGANVSQQCHGWSPIHYGIALQETDTVKEILKCNPEEVNAKTSSGSTPLHMATTADWKPMVNFLLAQGADPNAVNSNGNTPVHIAAGLDKSKVLDALVHFGGDLNFKDAKGRTAEDIARERNCKGVLEYIEKIRKRNDLTDPIEWAHGAKITPATRIFQIQPGETDMVKIQIFMQDLSERIASLDRLVSETD